MIKKSSWQTQLTEAITDLNMLCDHLNLPTDSLSICEKATKDFSLKVPNSWLNKITPGNLDDPLLLQILPQTQELISSAQFTTDPLEENKNTPVPGIIHRYYGRILLISTGSCAINCRYCFRRHFPYTDHILGQKHWSKLYSHIKKHPEINEIILSGGEPLLLPTKNLMKLSDQLLALPQIKTLRIHTRMPVFIPDRIDNEFLKWCASLKCKIIMVVHINHPNEIDSVFSNKMEKLRKLGIILFCQSTLLKKINDDAYVLRDLSEALFFKCGILPYYLHCLDKVKGANHFLVSLTQAKIIYKKLLSLLPGYLVPKLVQDAPGSLYKKPII